MNDWRLFVSDGISLAQKTLESPSEELRSVLRLCLVKMATVLPSLDIEEAIQALLYREQVLSTAAGGFAYPHAAVRCLSDVGIIFVGRFAKPIDWPLARPDESPTRWVVAQVFPKSLENGGYVRMQTGLTTFLRTFLPRIADDADFVEIVNTQLRARFEFGP